MKLNKITKKDVQDAIKALTDKGASCWFKELASTESSGIYTRLGRGKYTTLYFVVGWSNQAGYEKEDVDYYNEATGSALVAKIAYQHSNNIMQSDIDFDFNMPYDTDSMDVWDTEMAVPKGGFDDTDIAWYNKEAQDIWDTYGETGKLDLMESKQTESYVLGFNNRFVPKIYAADSKGNSWTSDIEDAYRFNAKPSINRTVKTNFASVATGVYNEYHKGGVVEPTDLEIQSISSESCTKKEGCKSSMQKKKESLKKSEAYTDTIKVSTEDIVVEITECNTYDSDGRSFSVDTPSIGMKYSLEEFKDMVQGMVEDCSGTVDYSRDGSEVVVVVNAPAEDFNSVDDYYSAAYIRGIIGVVSTSIEGVVNYLYN